MATRLNHTPYLKEQFKTLDSDVAAEILNKFDKSKNEHVETCSFINQEAGGRTKNKIIKLMATVWANNGGRKLSPPSNPIIFKTYYDVLLGKKDDKKETSSEFKKVVFEIMDNVTRKPLVFPFYYKIISNRISFRISKEQFSRKKAVKNRVLHSPLTTPTPTLLLE
jgi:hypothetical protein